MLTILLVGQQVKAQSDVSNADSTLTAIPKLDLKFAVVEKTSNQILANSINHISTSIGKDSVYVYQNERNNAFMIYGIDSSYHLVDLNVSHKFNPDNMNYQYSFSFDSLGTNNKYLVIKWFGRNYSEHSRSSGSQEFMCNQTISEYESIEEGVSIISLISKKVLFQGITEIRKTESQTQKPGRYKKEIKNEKITKAQFIQNYDYLNLFNHGYEDYYYWVLYNNLPFGFYQVIDDQYVLILKK